MFSAGDPVDYFARGDAGCNDISRRGSKKSEREMQRAAAAEGSAPVNLRLFIRR
jgi:hypothetical protein